LAFIFLFLNSYFLLFSVGSSTWLGLVSVSLCQQSLRRSNKTQLLEKSQRLNDYPILNNPAAFDPMLRNRANRHFSTAWWHSLPRTTVSTSHGNPRNNLVASDASEIGHNLDVGKRREPALNVLAQCAWPARGSGNWAGSRANLMSNARGVDDLVQDSELTMIPDFAEESLYYISRTHCISCALQDLTRIRPATAPRCGR
jgi:hypothetical protein